jgi:hypothetical protein
VYILSPCKTFAVKNNHIKKNNPLQKKPIENPLEKEIEEMIDREKTKGKIVSRLLNQTIPTTVKPGH